jgi:hypothetical protein
VYCRKELFILIFGAFRTDTTASAMMLFERRLQFPSAVLCAGPSGVFFSFGIEVEGNAEAGVARVRATDADGRPLPFTVLVDLHELTHLHRICAEPEAAGVLPVAGGTSISGCDEEGHLMLRVQSVLAVERDSLGVLVLTPGPDIPWSLGVSGGILHDFLAALDDCVAGAVLAA